MQLFFIDLECTKFLYCLLIHRARYLVRHKNLGMSEMFKKSSLAGLVTVLTVVLLSLSLSVAFAQYQTQQNADVTISSDGLAHVDQTSTAGGVSIDIAGTPGATGSVSTATYAANPQPGASAPTDVTLTHFVVVTFNMAASDFQGANITISYSDADVAGLSTPYVLYKYIPETNSYVQLNAVVDTAAKTMTATVSSTTDPLFAIGGATAATNTSSGIPVWTWAILAVVVIGVVLVAVLVMRSRKPSFDMLPAKSSI